MSGHDEFIGEAITPVMTEGVDPGRMAAGEPALPGAFRWRGGSFTISSGKNSASNPSSATRKPRTKPSGYPVRVASFAGERPSSPSMRQSGSLAQTRWSICIMGHLPASVLIQRGLMGSP